LEKQWKMDTAAVTDEKKSIEADGAELQAEQNSTGSSSPTTAVEARQIHGWKWAVAYTALLSVTFLFALDNTVVAAIQPSILKAFGHVELLDWVGVGFSLGSTIVLAWSKVYGIFDIKWLFIANVILFEAGSVICGAAPTMTAMIIGRVIVGVGGCGMYSGCLTYIAALTTLQERPIYTAGVALAWGVGSVLGPVVGAAFASNSHATWRWGFYINLVIGAVFAPGYLFLLPHTHTESVKTLKQKLHMIDWIGIIFFIGGCTDLITGITFVGSTYSWSSGSAIALWTVAGVLLVATIALSLWHPGVTAEDRLIPVHLVTNLQQMNLAIQMFLSSGIMLGTVYYIPLYFSFTKGDGVLASGVKLLPFVCFMVLGAIMNGALMPKTGHYMPWYVAGSALATIGCGLMLSVHVDTKSAAVYGYEILIGAGVGCYVVAGLAVSQALAPRKDVYNAVALQSIAQILGCVVFLAVAGRIFYTTSIEILQPMLPAGTSTSFISELIAGTSSSAFESLSAEVAQQVIIGITHSMRNVWIFLLSAGCLSFVLTLCLSRKRLSPQ